jgi:hypothetical protein
MLRAMALVGVLPAHRYRRYRLLFRPDRCRVSTFEGVPSVVLRAVALVGMLLARRCYRLP